MREHSSPEYARWRLTERLRKALVRQESPRLQMAALVAVSGMAGFLASVALLHAGLERIPVRYVTALAVAYAVFLTLLYLWLLRRRARRRAAWDGASPSIDVDPVVMFDLADLSSGSSGSSGFSAGGGHYGGGGASGSWSGGTGGKTPGSGGGGLDLSLDDDTVIVIALAVAAVVLFGASVWIVFSAPSLFAELLVDGGLSAGLYRRLGKIPHRPWLETALRKTVLPFLLAGLTLGAAGLIMESYAPEARSLGGVLAHVRVQD